MKKQMTKLAIAATAGLCLNTAAHARALTVTNTADGLSTVQFEVEGESEMYSGVLSEVRAGQATKLNLQFPFGLMTALLLPTSEGDKTILCSGSGVAIDNCSKESLMKKWQSFELGDDPETLEIIGNINSLSTVRVVLQKEMKLPKFGDRATYIECEFLDANFEGEVQLLEQTVPEAIEAQAASPNERPDAHFVFLIKSGNSTVEERNKRARLELFPLGANGVKYGSSFEMEQIAESEMTSGGSKQFLDRDTRFVFRTVNSDSEFLKMLSNPQTEVICAGLK